MTAMPSSCYIPYTVCGVCGHMAFGRLHFVYSIDFGQPRYHHIYISIYVNDLHSRAYMHDLFSLYDSALSVAKAWVFMCLMAWTPLGLLSGPYAVSPGAID